MKYSPLLQASYPLFILLFLMAFSSTLLAQSCTGNRRMGISFDHRFPFPPPIKIDVNEVVQFNIQPQWLVAEVEDAEGNREFVPPENLRVFSTLDYFDSHQSFQDYLIGQPSSSVPVRGYPKSF